MQAADLALARSRLYGLLGRLLLDGITAEVRPMVDVLPGLARAVPDLDEDRLAARHHRAFGLGVPPVASVFVDPHGQLGGEHTHRAATLLAETGLTEPRQDVSPDHLGLLLRALGFLAAAEADALRDGANSAVERVRGLQRRVLDEHLVPAWPPFALAVRSTSLSEWMAVVDLGGEALAEHALSLGVAAEEGAGEGVDVDALLEDPRTGLKRIVRWFLVPTNCGVWLTRGELEALAAAADVPRGFGERTQMFESTWFAAVDHGRTEELLDALDAVLTDHAEGYARLGKAGHAVEAWQARIGRGREVVRRMRAALG